MSLHFASLSFAGTKECHIEVTQAEKNECMLFERDQAVGRLMIKITKWCAEKDEVKESLGGSIYPMLLDECMARKLDKLAKKVD
jgi:hypothetical protein